MDANNAERGSVIWAGLGAGLAAIALVATVLSPAGWSSARNSKTNRSHGRYYAKFGTPTLENRQIYNEPNLSGVRLAPQTTDTGIVQRALRFRPITKTVEKKYGIKSNDVLLGMICVESFGNPLLPNLQRDGGLGLIHMNPPLTHRYGLKMITDSQKLRDRKQGEKIVQAIKAYNGDLRKLIELDDRFHPIKNIDAAARMLSDEYATTCSWDKALERYSNRSQYDSWVNGYVKKIHDHDFMRRVAADFESRNPGLRVEGNALTFDRYLETYRHVLKYYDLDRYARIERRHVSCRR